jgi:glycosyltransferase involved in cell wall biosynthesis
LNNQSKISSITIAKNEENNIRRCIESQLECIDEIIVLVDEFSTDKTSEIVKSFPLVKHKLVKWMGYAATKQMAVSLSANEWIFWIDADEKITKELSDELIQFKKAAAVNVVYSVPRKAYFLGKWIKHSGWYPGRVERLFNKNFAKFSESDVHEYLVYTGKASHLKNDLEHYTDPSIHHYFEKFNRYTTLAANELEKRGKKFHITDIVIRPFIFFIKMYFIKRGFMDGIQGFILAVFSSVYVFTKYCKFWELKRKDM